MPHDLRKTRKHRGSRTHGWGQVGQHRKHGMKGGRGNAGLHKHKWTYTVKYDPDHFIKKGFRNPTSIGQIQTINIGELEFLVDDLSRINKLKVEDGIPVLDLSELGYEKLLGEGKLTKPLIVKAQSHSKVAAEKIQHSGGRLKTPIKEES